MLTARGAEKLARADRSPDGRLDASGDGHQPSIRGAPAFYGCLVWFGIAKLPGERIGAEAFPTERGAAISRSDAVVGVPNWLLGAASTARLDRGCCCKRQVSLTIGQAPGLLSRSKARLAIDRTAVRQSGVSVERVDWLEFTAGAATLGFARPTIPKNQTLYNGLVCMHLGVLRRGLSSKRAVGEPPRTRTENRLINSRPLSSPPTRCFVLSFSRSRRGHSKRHSICT
jgi:hypothetical protein